jgi:hypothetical protein
MTHKVTVTVSAKPVGPTVFQVHDGDGRAGKLTVLRGGVRWKKKHGKKTQRLTWAQFDRRMNAE